MVTMTAWLVVRVVVLSVIGLAASVVPAHPIGTIRPVFPFPYGDVFLDAIDEETTGDESFAPVGRRRDANHRGIPDGERAHPMESREPHPRNLAHDLGGNFRHLLFGHRFVRLVLEKRDGLAVVVIADGTDERRDPTDFVSAYGSECLVQIERFALDFEQTHGFSLRSKVPDRPPAL